MKHKWLIIALALTMFMAVSLLPLYGNSARDYKVIKKAVKKGDNPGEVTWFKIQVTDNKTKKVKVNITLPFSLVDLLSECIEEDIDLGKDKGKINFKKLVQDLKKHGPMTLIEVYEDDETVKIWFE
jgi:hypothetical protein